MTKLRIKSHRATRAAGAVTMAAVAIAGLSIAAYAQGPATSVWQGAYTKEQAQRGKVDRKSVV